MNVLRLKSPTVPIWLAVLVAWSTTTSPVSSQDDSARACRSVHLAYKAEEGTVFYNEVAVEKSAAGTYFMCCGFSCGYFGIQQLADNRKVVIFSVWEPGKQNDPEVTPEARRVQVVERGENVKTRRFGGEGTGCQSMFDYDWQIGETCRFAVFAIKVEGRTRYAAFFYDAKANRWQHLATLSTIANDQLLRGHYSFIEDFRRNGTSARQERRASFGNGWVKVGEDWKPLQEARFTADNTRSDNIDASLSYGRFFLATGGDTKNDNNEPGNRLSLETVERKPPLDLPQSVFTKISKEETFRRVRILSYNIKHGRGNDGRVDLKRTAEVTRRLNPDIVALQEVDKRVERSGKVDEPQMLAKLTGLTHHAFGSFFDYQGGQYGMAVLSRYPITDNHNLRLPEGTEPRTSLLVHFDLGNSKTLSMANVHFYRTESERLSQANRLIESLVDRKVPTIVIGDFNSKPGSNVMQLFEDGWINPDKGTDRLTFSSDNPTTEIDYALVPRKSNLQFSSTDVIHEPLASDHRPLVLEVILTARNADGRK